MACYWGCGTKGNRAAWSIIMALFTIATSLIAAGVIGNFAGSGSKNCMKVFTNCADGSDQDLLTWGKWNNITIPDSKKECFELADQQCKLKLWSGLFLAGSGALLCCLFVSFFFCCCARRPSYGMEVMCAAPMAKGAVTQAPQGAMFYPANIPTSVPVQQEVYGPGRV